MAAVRHPLRIRVLNAIAIVISAALALFALVTVEHIYEAEAIQEEADAVYRICLSAARDLQEGSDYLTSEVRVYVVTGNREYMDAYLEELEVTDRRGRAVETLRGVFGDDEVAVDDLETALAFSNGLAERELYAMRLTAEATALDAVPALVSAVELEPADQELEPAAQRMLAEQIVLGDEYQTTKMQISESVRNCSDRLIALLNERVDAGNREMRTWLANMQRVVVGLLCIVVFVIFALIFLILWPLAAYTEQVRRGEPLIGSGASELRYMADAYNVIYHENHERTEHLRYAAERDPLTGLYNRGAYDQLLAEHRDGDMALLLVDVDFFKEVNDTYGHDGGDAVLKKVARLLEHSFRATDLPCRIGGDEFAVIMTGVTPALRDVIARKIGEVTKALLDTSDGLPRVTLSIGVVFGGAHQGEEDLYKAADRALYVVKERGRNGFAFYDEVVQES